MCPLFRPNPTRDQRFTRCARTRRRRFAATQTLLSVALSFSHHNPRGYTTIPTAPVTYLSDEIRGKLRVKMTACAPCRSTSDGRVVHLGPNLKSHAREMHAVVVRRTNIAHCTPSHCQVPAITPGKWASSKRTFATGSNGSKPDVPISPGSDRFDGSLLIAAPASIAAGR